METTTNSTYGQALDLSASLPLDEQEALAETLRQRLIEQRRTEIAREAAAIRQAVQEGRSRPGTLEELKPELLAELES